MGRIARLQPVLRFAAIYANRLESLQWARDQMESVWGGIALSSPIWPFTETHYYTASMGSDLKKQLLVFSGLHNPEDMPDWKCQSNEWEDVYQSLGGHSVQRAVNIDPGYVTLAKLVLATTKDRDHRIYLRRGIFAEVTLHFKHGKWQSDRWTYADYQRAEYHDFLNECRDHLKQCLLAYEREVSK